MALAGTIGLIVAIIGIIIAASLLNVASQRRKEVEKALADALARSQEILAKAELEAENQKKAMLLSAKDEAFHLRTEAEKEIREQQSELTKRENRLLQKEESLEEKLEKAQQRQQALTSREIELDSLKHEIEKLRQNQLRELERIAGLTSEEAKKILLSKLEQDLEREVALKVKQSEHEAKESADKKAREIITTAIQRCAVDHSVESTVSVVTLPSDEMKGRIIGREGRNIRALESATGIDLIIDDTPEAVVLSSFDPIRREIARRALQALISDGRIHPQRIEEQVEKARKEVEQQMKEDGEATLLDVGIQGVHPELVKTLGRLRYRTSYGQNVLAHSKEVCLIARMIAEEIGANVQIAKRAALFHDLGKALSHEMEGSHAVNGADLAAKYGENAAVTHAIRAHHNDEEPSTVEAVICMIADAISAARPGARRENIDVYFKRLQKLEEIANSFPGVERTFAIQAGREVRVMVQPEVVDDAMAHKLARDMAARIQGEMEYPGMIKVTVIRETRSTEYAK